MSKKILSLLFLIICITTLCCCGIKAEKVDDDSDYYIEENEDDEEEIIEYSENLSYEYLNEKNFGITEYAEIKGIVLSKQDEQSYIVAFDEDYNKPFLISTEKELKVNDNIVAQGSVSSKVAVKGLDGNTIMIPQMICDKVGVEKPKLTLEQENAIGSAENYIRYSGFSREGLIDQLEYEGYSTESATFAADYIDVDWNEECKESAKDYLKYSTFSRQGLHDQLQYEGFTEEQIEYGLSAVGY